MPAHVAEYNWVAFLRLLSLSRSERILPLIGLGNVSAAGLRAFARERLNIREQIVPDAYAEWFAEGRRALVELVYQAAPNVPEMVAELLFVGEDARAWTHFLMDVANAPDNDDVWDMLSIAGDKGLGMRQVAHGFRAAWDVGYQAADQLAAAPRDEWDNELVAALPEGAGLLDELVDILGIQLVVRTVRCLATGLGRDRLLQLTQEVNRSRRYLAAGSRALVVEPFLKPVADTTN